MHASLHADSTFVPLPSPLELVADGREAYAAPIRIWYRLHSKERFRRRRTFYCRSQLIAISSSSVRFPNLITLQNRDPCPGGVIGVCCAYFLAKRGILRECRIHCSWASSNQQARARWASPEIPLSSAQSSVRPPDSILRWRNGSGLSAIPVPKHTLNSPCGPWDRWVTRAAGCSTS